MTKHIVIRFFLYFYHQRKPN